MEMQTSMKIRIDMHKHVDRSLSMGLGSSNVSFVNDLRLLSYSSRYLYAWRIMPFMTN